jgi:hypothetical protein
VFKLGSLEQRTEESQSALTRRREHSMSLRIAKQQTNECCTTEALHGGTSSVQASFLFFFVAKEF